MVFGIVACPFALAQEGDEVSRRKEEIIDLQNIGPLGFRNLVACSKVMDYGSYVPLPDNKVKAGDVIFFYFEPQNVFTRRAEEKYEIWFTQDMIILTGEQQEIFKKANVLEIHYQSSSPRLDLYGINQLTLTNLPPGKYLFKAIIYDKLKGEEASATWPFEVVK
ncbi:MAG: hypothetical protein JRJ29_02150 [Deltaproteobacteria bacterium]|nr:hypothetical protein [Deltaproteobacteria bacterium]